MLHHPSVQTLFYGTTVAGFVGLFHAMRPGAPGEQHGWAGSLNARYEGGNPLLNVLELLKSGGRTPSMAFREAMEAESYLRLS